ncbi:unnamed protein product, partial [Didymodactylos carnosus]
MLLRDADPSPSGNTLKGANIVKSKIDISKIKVWNYDDINLPKFDEANAVIAKWAIFKETNENSFVYFVLEIQVVPDNYHHQDEYHMRFRYEKQPITTDQNKNQIKIIQYMFTNDVNEQQQLFASYYNRIATMPRITKIKDMLPNNIGSKLLIQLLWHRRIDTQSIDDSICQLVESIWLESIGDLEEMLSVQPETITLKKIIEAEAVLLEQKRLLDTNIDTVSSEINTKFYSLIPHNSSFMLDLNNRRILTEKMNLCQMLRDMLTVNEITNWNIKASIEAKYRSLNCYINTIDKDSIEFGRITNMIKSSTNPNEEVIVHNIFEITRQTEAINFKATLNNQCQLFHGSKYSNFLGILSRGLLMPKIVVKEFGGTRSDIGHLGYGLYFSDSISTSLKYTVKSNQNGKRLLCICNVALGDSAQHYSYATDLTQPPENFHSVHGVQKTIDNHSMFEDNEYAIYNLDQQRLLYLVVVSWKPHDIISSVPTILPIIRDQIIDRQTSVEVPELIEDEVIQIAEQDYGLISAGQRLPLKEFHIRAQLVDVTAEVVLYQLYHNNSSRAIEAKYVFPLDEHSTVCGFEAHINNKVIVGVVKEKEQAKKEYREAIEKDYGAYLMDQEQPEVFSVSVGNLPPNCEVVIKITYVVELAIEN